MQCLPLHSLIRATGARTVNYLRSFRTDLHWKLNVPPPFSLDIEGAELPVLETLPWLEVDIEIISVETNHAGSVFPGSQVLQAV
jgi:hypothetical protein